MHVSPCAWYCSRISRSAGSAWRTIGQPLPWTISTTAFMSDE